LSKGPFLFGLCKVNLQVLYIFFESVNPGCSDLTNCLRVIVFELFYDVDIAGFFQLLDLYTQVAGRSICFKKVNSASFTLIRSDITAKRN
jgi:hypothetical protein